ncbi:hypothetical protein CALVIDRAFT_533309 [Calocera viscosa TUFC12733]|uniref:Uncharacterized protein n=1 Tax=Calocera viscosa (strain TUFC12733) TaxID=1330018 RepID=A0A167RK98_CALVF|nr:hypothetical protein CALVIDRAFT_533309 [Calocera viscosa TUFC12733]
MMVAQQTPNTSMHDPASYSPTSSSNRSSFGNDPRRLTDDPVTAYARALHEYTRKLWLEALRQEQMTKEKMGSEPDRHRKGQWRNGKLRA